MLAVVTQLTARFAVVQLHAPRDWPGSRRAIVFMPRTKPWTKMITGREVTVCATLNPLDSPVVIVDGRAHVPASRLFFGPPWRGSNAWRVPWSRRHPKARRSTRPGWSET
jgi:hypothetical protein